LKTDGTPEPPAVTIKLIEHDWPPKLIGKVAVPVDVGVPETLKDKFPFPVVSVPDCNVAVKPDTPVDAIAAPTGYATPFPPAYGTVATALYDTFEVAAAEKDALLQESVFTDAPTTIGVFFEQEIAAVMASKKIPIFNFIIVLVWFIYCKSNS
jgi:hypothetical protein